LVLSAVMFDVERRVRGQHPLATTPAIGILDLEYADDTALIARTTEIANALLRAVQEEAVRYGLHLNKDKTCRLAYNTEEQVRLADGTEVPRVDEVKYLGAFIDHLGRAGPEVRARISHAMARMTQLKPIWATRDFEMKLKLRVLEQCVFGALLYGLHAMHLTELWKKKLDATQIRGLRRVLRIRTTYSSTILQEEPVTNQEVARRAGAVPLSDQLARNRLKLLGRVLRRDGSDPLRAATYDRFGHPKRLGGMRRMGAPRHLWN